jgi:hypothetical protein
MCALKGQITFLELQKDVFALQRKLESFFLIWKEEHQCFAERDCDHDRDPDRDRDREIDINP